MFDVLHQSTVSPEGHGVYITNWGDVNGNLVAGTVQSGSVLANTIIQKAGHVKGSLTAGLTKSGDATGNSVYVQGGSVDSGITGGYTASGSAFLNLVEISGGAVRGIVTAGDTLKGDVRDNKLVMTGGHMEGSLVGGDTRNGIAVNNEVVVRGTTGNGECSVNCDVYGSRSLGLVAQGNKVTIADAVVGGDVYASYAYNAELAKGVSNNTVNIIGSGASLDGHKGGETYIGGTVYGSNTDGAGNNVNIYGSDVYLYGGVAKAQELNVYGSGVSFGSVSSVQAMNIYGTGVSVGSMSSVGSLNFIVGSNIAAGSTMLTLVGDSTVDLTGTTVSVTLSASALSGAITLIEGDFIISDAAKNMTVTASNGAKGQVSWTGNALTLTMGSPARPALRKAAAVLHQSTVSPEGHGVYITNWSDVNGNLVAGNVQSGSVLANTIIQKAGHVKGSLTAGLTKSGDATGNSVYVQGGSVDSGITGGYTASGSAFLNLVEISGGAVRGIVTAGDTLKGDVRDNKLVMTGGHMEGSLVGGDTRNGIAVNNEVVVRGTTGNGECSVNCDVYGSRSLGLVAQGNKVTIADAVVGGDVYASYAYNAELAKGVSNNTVNIIGSGASLDGHKGGETYIGGTVYGSNTDGAGNNVNIYGSDVYLYGGVAKAQELNVYGSGVSFGSVSSVQAMNIYGTGVSVGSMSSVGSLNFIVGSNIAAGSTMLTLVGDSTVDLTGTTVSVTLSASALSGAITLIEGDFIISDAAKNMTVTASNGAKGQVSWTGNALTLTMGSPARPALRKAAGAQTGTTMPPAYEIGVFNDIPDNILSGSGDHVTVVNKGNFQGYLLGGSLSSGIVYYNTVTNTGKVDGVVYGGYVKDGRVLYNNVNISGGEVTLDVAGGYAYTGVSGANTVDISAGSIGRQVWGGFTRDGRAVFNTVNMSGGSVGSFVVAGSALNGDAYLNEVHMSGGEVKGYVMGGGSMYGDAYLNKVYLTGGKVASDVIGGYAVGTEVRDNTVYLANTTVGRDVYAGYTELTNMGPKVFNNTLNLVGAGATLDGVRGGNISVAGTIGAANVAGLGNVINVYGTGISAGNIGGAQSLNFFLGDSITSGSTMLTLTSSADTDLSGTYVNVSVSASSLLGGGDTVTLIDKQSGKLILGGSLKPIQSVTTLGGQSLATIRVKDNDLVLTLSGSAAPMLKTAAAAGAAEPVETALAEDAEQAEAGAPVAKAAALDLVGEEDELITLQFQLGEAPAKAAATATVDQVMEALKSVAETRVAAVATVNRAADFMCATGIHQAKLAARENGGAALFTAVGGSRLRYSTGSSVQSNGLNVAAGVSKAFDGLTLAAAGEYASTDFDSHVGAISAKGENKLYGGALLLDWQGKGGWHLEGAARAGRVSSEYKGWASLKDDATYVAVMAGAGKNVTLSDDTCLDLYARYMFSNTGSSTAKGAENVKYDSVSSQRTVLGARVNHKVGDKAAVYAGASWMYEFDGDARVSVGDIKSPAPSLGGSSGMLEVGTTFAPFGSDRVLINLNLNGWTGVQRGISGGVGVSYSF